MFLSVVIPTYNRLPILEKCLIALEDQKIPNGLLGYEIVVVDDGSTDGTCDWLRTNTKVFPHVTLVEQEHAGPAQGRNTGVINSKGNIIVFIDSDLVVTYTFLESHFRKLTKSWVRRGDQLCFTYGAVINTANFDNPTSEPHKISDLSWAYFATGNVAIEKDLLEKSGLFDTSFKLYGWEDLELGERLRKMGVELIRCPEAVGYHWHPSLKINQINDLVRIERERAKMALVFYRKHPSFRVRLIIQFTWFQRLLWELLTIGGLLNQETLKPILRLLINNGFSGLAMEILRLPLNLIWVREIYREAESIYIN